MNGSVCNVCGAPATVRDTEYDEYYCNEHGEEYQVFEGPHERLASHDEEGPYVTKTGKVLTEEDIEKLSEEAEAGYDVSQLKEHRRLRKERMDDIAEGLIPLGAEEAMLEYELQQPLVPWTVTIEITLSAHGQKHAESLGTEVLDHALAGLDGAAGAVMRVEPNA